MLLQCPAHTYAHTCACSGHGSRTGTSLLHPLKPGDSLLNPGPRAKPRSPLGSLSSPGRADSRWPGGGAPLSMHRATLKGVCAQWKKTRGSSLLNVWNCLQTFGLVFRLIIKIFTTCLIGNKVNELEIFYLIFS